jgi:hypothetical protein
MMEREILERIRELDKRLKALEARDSDGVVTDYSTTSTVTGWSSTTAKGIYYYKIGKIVFVRFYITGTSDSTAVFFSLPYAKVAGMNVTVAIQATDNGGTATVGMAQMSTTATSTVNCYTSIAGAAWTNSGTKAVAGEFFYWTA